MRKISKYIVHIWTIKRNNVYASLIICKRINWFYSNQSIDKTTHVHVRHVKQHEPLKERHGLRHERVSLTIVWVLLLKETREESHLKICGPWVIVRCDVSVIQVLERFLIIKANNAYWTHDSNASNASHANLTNLRLDKLPHDQRNHELHKCACKRRQRGHVCETMWLQCKAVLS